MKDLVYFLFCIATAMIGYQMHHSVGYAIFDLIFAPIVWIKWLIYHEINLTIIIETFKFLAK